MKLPKLDLGYLPRMVRTRPGFTLVVVLTLALVLGPTTAIFSVVNSVLLQPLPYPDPGELVVIHSTTPQFGVVSVAYPDFEDWRRRNDSFDSLAAHMDGVLTLTDRGGAEHLRSRAVSADYFRAFGLDPLAGRFFSADEDQPGTSPTVVLSEGFWQRRFGGDESLIGQSLTLDGNSYTILGVAPQNYHYTRTVDCYVPLGLQAPDLQRRGERPGIGTIARLREGVSLEQARSSLEAVAASIAEQFPDTNKGDSVVLVPLEEEVIGDSRQPILLLWWAIFFVVLIAFANLANLFLVRAVERRREFALRMAVGARRGGVVLQQISETGQLFLVGGLVAVLLVLWTRGGLSQFIPPGVPRVDELEIGSAVVGMVLLFTLLAGAMVGLVPALQSTRAGWVNALKQGSREVGVRGIMTSVLVVCQIALTVLLLSSAGLTAISFWRLTNVDPGFETEDILTLRTVLPEAKYPNAGTMLTFYDRVHEEVTALPQVRRAALTSNLVMSHGNINSFFLDDRPMPEQMFSGLIYSVSKDYFSVMGISLLQGRVFDNTDRPDTVRVTVIDSKLADRYWPAGDPLGHGLCLDDGSETGLCWQIVGVVEHVKQEGLDEDSQMQFYLPYVQMPTEYIPFIIRDMTLVASMPGASSAVDPVKEAIWKVDRDQPVYNVVTVRQLLDASLGREHFALMLLMFCASVALVFSVLGIYAVMSYSVVQRTREIGVRMALGSQPEQILWLFLSRGMRLAAIGLVLGLAGGLLAAHTVATRLYGITINEPWIYVGVGAGLALVALIAVYLPSRRATRVDPIVALRSE